MNQLLYVDLLSSSPWGSVTKTSSSEKQVVVDFHAKWCGPCKNVAPAYDQLSLKYPDAKFLKADIDKLPVSELDLQIQDNSLTIKSGSSIICRSNFGSFFCILP
jgi:thiol-disulfide isomerase/thioredoxin